MTSRIVIGRVIGMFDALTVNELFALADMMWSGAHKSDSYEIVDELSGIALEAELAWGV